MGAPLLDRQLPHAFNNTFHSDHHLRPRTPYYELHAMYGAPRLPASYFTMFCVALVPPLWRRLMDPRLDALSEALGQAGRGLPDVLGPSGAGRYNSCLKNWGCHFGRRSMRYRCILSYRTSRSETLSMWRTQAAGDDVRSAAAAAITALGRRLRRP